ncbi:MAG: DMT family transporter [Pelagibacteraceae bacterium]|jgi:drug/metabolite transporter (DMT)-like permease|nr:DMT family transporter [Pelagibacteraceae bacterium]MBT5212956.1 DMT family transporter [Pelagibacteraceae bacterium]MBT6197434.1 DMT family transporter [Pelagibacteraceae bacterium]
MTKNVLLASSCLLIASVFFVINDGIINYLSSIDIKFYHFIFYGSPAYLIVPLYLFFTGNFKKHIVSTNYYVVFFRSITFAPMPFITFISLENITLPEFTTLNMSSPMIAAIFAYIFLKEKLNIYIYLSLLIGFSGVLFVIQPGFDTFNKYYLVTLFGVILITSTTTIVNRFNNVITAIGYFIYGGLIIHLISFILFIYDPLEVSMNVFIFITIASVFINSAIFLSTFAFKVAQKYYASIFCLVYLQIVWSCLIGFYFFNEYLNKFALLGALLIILSGLISIPGQIRQINEK